MNGAPVAHLTCPRVALSGEEAARSASCLEPHDRLPERLNHSAGFRVGTVLDTIELPLERGNESLDLGLLKHGDAAVPCVSIAETDEDVWPFLPAR